ncbi:MAG: aspartate ammonia-lyase [Bacteroidota bacterium]|nr:aspartate ammonia-lyase [Bacteroidota bacterium]
MDTTTQLKFFTKVELFEGLDKKEIKNISALATLKALGKGDVIFEEHNPRKNIYLIYAGEVELFKKSAFGEEKRVTFMRAYDFLGEAAIVDESPHGTSARTLSKAKIFIIKKEDFNIYLENNPITAVKIIKKITGVISRRMSHSNTRMMNVGAQYVSGRTRKEHDLLGDRMIPYEFFYGVQTMRARENFNISGVSINFYPDLVRALTSVKLVAAKANNKLGMLSDDKAEAIEDACKKILGGQYHRHFVVDMIQGGAGTSTNMNANEVIANLALEYMGKEKGEYKYCHPNNHVNLSQSTNDAYPTAVKIALKQRSKKLVNSVTALINAFKTKAEEFDNILKMGRTQLQDAVPMTLGQEFGAYAVTLQEDLIQLKYNSDLLLKINMGATAIGTGLNAHPDFANLVVDYLKEETGLKVWLAEDLVEATQNTGSFVMFSSALKRLAIKLSKISNDLRLLSSGPRAGFNEINLPAVQPGSSIMPGKVNPVIPEVINQIAFKVIGNDLTVSMAAEAGQLELNVMEPVIVQSLFESIEMLINGISVFKYKAIEGITANKEHTESTVKNSIGLVTALNPVLGYEVSTRIAKEALAHDKSVYDLVLEQKLMSKEMLDDILSPERMISPHKL